MIDYHTEEEKIWTTSNGEKINVINMDDNHLNNAYNYLKDKTRNHKVKGNLRLKWIQIFFEEKVRRQYLDKLYEIY